MRTAKMFSKSVCSVPRTLNGGLEGSQGPNGSGGGTDSGDVTSSFKAVLKVTGNVANFANF